MPPTWISMYEFDSFILCPTAANFSTHPPVFPDGDEIHAPSAGKRAAT